MWKMENNWTKNYKKLYRKSKSEEKVPQKWNYLTKQQDNFFKKCDSTWFEITV